METLLTPEFVISVLLALLVWYLCGRFLYILDEVGLDPVLASQEEPPITLRGEVPPHQQLVSLIFGLGIGLVILTVMARLNLSEILSAPGGIPPLGFNRFSGGEAGALFYFVFGLALLSLSRLMSLRAHWNRLRIPISSRNLTRQWGMYSLFFFMILAVVISLLPTSTLFPGVITEWVKVIPSYYVVDTVDSVAGYGSGWPDIWQNLLILVAFSAAVLLAGMVALRRRFQ